MIRCQKDPVDRIETYLLLGRFFDEPSFACSPSYRRLMLPDGVRVFRRIENSLRDVEKMDAEAAHFIEAIRTVKRGVR